VQQRRSVIRRVDGIAAGHDWHLIQRLRG
jgi:hypothetical protein